jgi:hypothetical protein
MVFEYGTCHYICEDGGFDYRGTSEHDEDNSGSRGWDYGWSFELEG